MESHWAPSSFPSLQMFDCCWLDSSVAPALWLTWPWFLDPYVVAWYGVLKNCHSSRKWRCCRSTGLWEALCFVHCTKSCALCGSEGGCHSHLLEPTLSLMLLKIFFWQPRHTDNSYWAESQLKSPHLFHIGSYHSSLLLLAFWAQVKNLKLIPLKLHLVRLGSLIQEPDASFPFGSWLCSQQKAFSAKFDFIWLQGKKIPLYFELEILLASPSERGIS